MTGLLSPQDEIPQTKMTPSEISSVRQSRAADPARSVQVNASAGTGKTKVLTQRVLRLLLPRADGTPGARPDRILCLTYTKAAAAEMEGRLTKTLSEWAVCPESLLDKHLADVLGCSPTDDQRRVARHLFSRMVDGPEQVRLMTIHAFCNSILARFPIEAGISPNFSQIEEAEADALLLMARINVLAGAGKDPDLLRDLHDISVLIDDGSMVQVLQALFKQRRQLAHVLRAYDPNMWGVLYRRGLGLPEDLTFANWGDQIVHLTPAVLDDLRCLATKMGASKTKTDQTRADVIAMWLALSPRDRAANFDQLLPAFMGKTKRHERRDQGVFKADPDLADLYFRTGDWAIALDDQKRHLALIESNISLLKVGAAILRDYTRLKKDRSVLDFDDLIQHTVALLQGNVTVDGRVLPMVPWVMYKLDGGIDHILVDEAQDTNPDQWKIVSSLVEEFQAGDGRQGAGARTLFIVGDRKQSIYSFQGADAESFDRSLDRLAVRGAAGGVPLENIALDVSFRSVPAVLDVVDATFDDDLLRARLRLKEKMVHLAAREGQAGRVELWPPMQDNAEQEGALPWGLPIEIRTPQHVKARLARKIAATIRNWLDEGKILPARSRPITPRDILILVRNRKPMSFLLSALRDQKIPVSGVDRMKLLDALPVQDLMALARFVLLPDDDLTLACALKSPLLGLNDDDLIALCPGRKGSLWEVLCAHTDRYRLAVDYLQSLRQQAQGAGCHAFFTHILQAPCPADPEGSGLRALIKRLGPDAREMIAELQQQALYHDEGGDTLQEFVDRLQAENPEIKRSTDGADDVVRVMTVHGSKGLEAPIVILADAIQSKRKPRDVALYWPEQTGAPLPFWAPRSKDRPPVFDPVVAAAQEAAQAENARLLYVAMTRAQDYLLIAGAQPNQGADEESWYYAIRQGMERLSSRDGFSRIKAEDAEDILVFETPQRVPVTKPEETKKERDKQQDMPLSFLLPPPRRQGVQRPLRPERASGPVEALSPLLLQKDPQRFKRGLMTHKLLQVLPDVPPAGRALAAEHYAERQGVDLSPQDRRRVIDEVMAILTHPDWVDLFGPGSRAEVPVTGMLDHGRLIAGQIDRLLVTQDRILILDYKTNRPPPKTLDRVPSDYIAQMRAYRDLLRQIYPGRAVVCALLWTDGPRLMTIPDDWLG